MKIAISGPSSRAGGGPLRRFHRPRIGRGLLLTAALLTPLSATTAAHADSGGNNTSTVTITPPVIRSLTVTSPSPSQFTNCNDASGAITTLTLDGGSCFLGRVGPTSVTGGVTITNGAEAGHIDISGANAVPADNGTPWALAAAIGPDQYVERSISAGVSGELLSTTPTCDVVFGGTNCSASAGQSQSEALYIQAPTSSTDTSSSFTVTTTWTAVP